ncbi:MAG: Gfo/Idh/MocA family oxidoreductase [Planctomycetaceae bacterium]|jgi:predicted dehydrogenase|nr:Gfo/Idh/MocA family oxidoreductase [Planctomycetaceae bacterium]
MLPSLFNTSRRGFLKTSGILAGTVLAGTAVPKVHAASDDTINLAWVGCGGRGSGAVRQALSTAGPTRLVAVADAFDYRAKNAYNALNGDEKFKGKIDVEDRCYGGLDSYKKAIDALKPGDVAVIATPAGFRPAHYAYAVEKGVHAFIEKPVAVDAPGCKKMLAANEIAKQKNLKVAVGLNNRHYFRTEETVKAIQDGKIGDIIACYVYRMHGPFGFFYDNKLSALQNQLLGFQNWTWGSGSFMVDWMIHNIDICCWARKEMLPVSVQGQGGRQVRRANDQMFDHAAYEYRFGDGVKMIVQLRQIANTYSSFRSVIHGTKGSAVVGEGVGDPAIYKGYLERKEDIVWQPETPRCDSYQEEHNRLFEAIRSDKPYNEVERGVDATFTSICARMAVDSGQELTREQCWASAYELAPGIENLTLDSEPPVKPDRETGSYAASIAIPGTTKQY